MLGNRSTPSTVSSSSQGCSATERGDHVPGAVLIMTASA